MKLRSTSLSGLDPNKFCSLLILPLLLIVAFFEFSQIIEVFNMKCAIIILFFWINIASATVTLPQKIDLRFFKNYYSLYCISKLKISMVSCNSTELTATNLICLVQSTSNTTQSISVGFELIRKIDIVYVSCYYH